MSDTGWQQAILQGIGIRIEVMSELYPKAYLLLTTAFAAIGYALLIVFPLLAVASVVGMYVSLVSATGVPWIQLLAWVLVGVVSGLVSFRISRFRPTLPAGIVLDRTQAPELFLLVEDTAAHFNCPDIDRIVMTCAYQLDVTSTPRRALPGSSIHSLVIGLPLMQCLSTTRFSCLLARRLGQYSKRTNRLLNWLFELRDIWPLYQLPADGTNSGFFPLQRIFSIYAPLYSTISTAAARLDELQADSYAMELFSDEEVLDSITTDTVYRLFLREKYWPVIRKLGARDAALVTRAHTGIMKVLHAGLQTGTIKHWIDNAMTMEQLYDDPWPLLARRLENIGHVQARMDSHITESAAEDYLGTFSSDLVAALESMPRSEYPGMRPLPLLAALQRRINCAMHGLASRRELRH